MSRIAASMSVETKQNICVVGAGLAGSECTWQLAKRGIAVTLIEMRPQKTTAAHQSASAAELVCSNSLRGNDIANAVGLLKEEMASLDSLIMQAAYHARVPAGGALAVDRDSFSEFIESKLNALPNLTRRPGVVVAVEKSEQGVAVVFEDGERLSASQVVLATGPLTDDVLAKWLQDQIKSDYLYFYDAIAPIVEKDSIDFNQVYYGSRYGKGGKDYINCAMDEDQYNAFIDAIENAELAPVHDFDKAQFFEACLPIEEMVARGRETLRFGPLKPVGLERPDGSKPHAVVQLRQDNLHASLYNMVGFQTRMKWGEQKRIFGMLPGLANANFARMGSMHRNTYVCSPAVLTDHLSLKTLPQVHLAGQITGCEGYVESAAVGLHMGLYLSAQEQGLSYVRPPATTALGALLHHLTKADPNDYQPMNINFGLFTEFEERLKRHDKKLAYVKRAVADFRSWYYQIMQKEAA